MPVVTFDDRITLDLGSHRVELISFGTTHTPDTTVAWLPRERILFTADLLFVELHPTGDERSDVANWQRVLQTLAGWSPQSVVPGHGWQRKQAAARSAALFRNHAQSGLRDSGKSFAEIKNGIRAGLGEFASWPRERAIPASAEQVYRELAAP